MAIYLLGAINKSDPESYSRYEVEGFETVLKYGAEPLVVDDAPQVIEGTLPGNRIIMLRFADEKALNAWYNSEEYQAAKKLRLKTADTPFLITFQEKLPPHLVQKLNVLTGRGG